MTQLISDILMKNELNKGLQGASSKKIYPNKPSADGGSNICFWKNQTPPLPSSGLENAKLNSKVDFWTLKMHTEIKVSLAFCNFKMKPRPV